MHALTMDRIFPARRVFVVLTVVWMIFTILGSWYPFQYQPRTVGDAWLVWMRSGEIHSVVKTDLAINLFLGFPLGLFSSLSFSRTSKNSSVWRGIFIAGLLLCNVFVLALLVELGQHWFGNRVPSMFDTAAQTLGGFLGLSVAWFRGEWLMARFDLVFFNNRMKPADAFLDLYFAGYILWMLFPFIPCVSPTELSSKWRGGMIDLSLVAEWNVDFWQAGYTVLVSATTAFPIGYRVASRSFVALTKKPWLNAIASSTLVVVLLEIAQVFIETRSAQLADAFWSCVGTGSGVATFFHFSGTQQSSFLASSRVSRTTGLCSLAAFTVVYLSMAWAPFEWLKSWAEISHRAKHSWSTLFSQLLSGNDFYNASNLFRTGMLSAPLGAISFVAFNSLLKRHLELALLLAAICVLVVCLGAEAGQVMSVRHSPSGLGAFVRVLGGVLGMAVAFRIMQPCRVNGCEK